jgi:NAD-dependent deacetylase
VADSGEGRNRKTVKGARDAAAKNGGRAGKNARGSSGAAPTKDTDLAPPKKRGGSAEIARLAELVRDADSVVALTGAGISVPSGIPDFRSPGTGTWQKVDPMKVAHIDSFRADPMRFWHFYGERFATLGGKRPNGAHHALVAMERRDMLDGVITQNVDMLHRKAGTSELIEVHGSIARCTCPDCGGSIPQLEVRARRLGDPDGIPRCEVCGGPLRPEVVLFGEPLSEQAMARARELCAGADLILCIGSSLEVQPVGALPLLTREAGGAIAILTQGRTPLDRLAAVRLGGDIVDELQALIAALDIDDARGGPRF